MASVEFGSLIRMATNSRASAVGQGIFAGNVTNLAFGGTNRTTLFITTLTEGGGGVYSTETNIPGLPY